jgi:hypothetical protein
MISRMIFLSFISVGCTGLTFVPMFFSDELKISPFEGFGKHRGALR